MTVNLLLAATCVLLLAASAFFSGSETALFALDPRQRHELSRSHDPAARRVTTLLRELNTVLVMLLVGNTVVNILLAVLSTRLILRTVGPEHGPLVSLVGVTGVLVIVGEIMPKSVAVNAPRRYSMRMSGPLLRARRVLSGPTRVFRRISRLFVEMLDRLVPGDRLEMQGDEMLGLLSLGEESGSFGARERQLAEGVFQLGDLAVEEVMTPRVDLFLLDGAMPVGEAAAVMRRTGHSLAPVTGETSDDVLGLVNALALLGETDATRRVGELATPAEYCPETRKAGSLLMELLEKGAPLAVVLDEYGSLAGLATLEDLFEVIVGDIRDSHDSESLRYHLPTPDTLIASSRLPVERVHELLGVMLSPGSAETLGGHLMERLGEVPETGRPYTVDGLVWTVLSARGPALGTLRLERRP